MKEGFRQSMAWLHTWTGVVVGWVVFFVFVTGTAGYVDNEITRWMKPELPLAGQAQKGERDTQVRLALDRLEAVAPGARNWTVTLPHQSLNPRGEHPFLISWEDMPGRNHEQGRRGSEILDPVTGEFSVETEGRATGGGGLLYRMHYILHYMPYQTGIALVGACTMLMFLAILSGVITHKKIFTDFFTFRPGKGQRSWLDAHNVVSVMSLPFFLMITYTGLMFFAFDYMPAARDVVYGSTQADRQAYFREAFPRDTGTHDPMVRPAADVAGLVARAEAEWGAGKVAGVRMARPQGEPAYVDVTRVVDGRLLVYVADRLRYSAEDGRPLSHDDRRSNTQNVRDVMLSLHEGLFANWWLRWLYVIMGLMGCAVIGTGLVMWTVKRRTQHQKKHGSSRLDAAGLRVVEVLNAGTLVGLPLAVAAYFWANRLLPVSLGSRPDWEAHCMFLVWGWSFLYASLRPLKRAWLELLWLTVAAYALLPVLNALTTQRHLGVTLPHGDWGLAGFDLSMLGLAAIFAYIAHKLRRRWLGALAQARPAAGAVPVTARESTT
ncbi:FIG138928: iron-regulated membrane protein [plant metagenome]|uniref:FIG138928: iron-regulated membrane protein n=1 Tax=plant metagenome TaxID=1297885 RepID=A0A484V0L6_9ZZZZ